jgi:hypothetical protein
MSGKKGNGFEALVEQMQKDVIEESDWPAVTGGTCSEADLPAWLGGLDLSALDVRIWEYTDRCTIGADDPPPEDAGRLERARLFGAKGDLDVRRDGGAFRWCYAGERERAPDGKMLPWPGTAENPVHRRVRTALLWGTREKDQQQWFDDRVAGAALTYPVEGAPERMQVRYHEYTQAGRTLVVWLRGLEGRDG